MGSSLSRIYGKREVRILILGLDAAGKTTMLYQLKLGEVVTTIPTIGFNVETINSNGIEFTFWDVGLRDKSRPLIRHYYQNTQAIVFVVDCLDVERMAEAKEFLRDITAEDEMRDVPVLVMANKQDSAKACPPEQVADALGLTSITDRPWHIVPCSATSGTGLTDGLHWLASTLTGKMIRSDIEDSLKTSAKDVSDAGGYSMNFLSKGYKYLLGLTGCGKNAAITNK